MCGIFGYLKSSKDTISDPAKVCIEALKRLEYRGYDSAGIAAIQNDKIISCKAVGKVEILESLYNKSPVLTDIAIAHTRWATHGKLTVDNAHPHFDETKSLALVHNGIIENYQQLKKQLQLKNIQFNSETDTEVLTKLLSSNYQGDLLDSICKTLPLLEGSFAFAMLHAMHPRSLIATARHCPLIIGENEETGDFFISSDQYAIGNGNILISYLKDGEIAFIDKGKLSFYDPNKKSIVIEKKPFLFDFVHSTKQGFEHYMLKEIHEQPETFKKCIEGRYEQEFGTAKFDELTISPKELLSIKHILILGCGTSWHAGCIAASMIESMARIPTQCEIASEFRYTDPIISENTLVIAISQSGETADTLAALKEAKAKGAKILSICNVDNSSITRESHSNLLLKAGPEISVCSTKAFTSQLGVLSLFALYLSRLHHMKKEEGRVFLDQIKTIPYAIEQVLYNQEKIKELSTKYAKYENFFFLGRRYMYPTSLEAALKLKEISYINACGYPAGEMKHGPIALINERCPVIALCGNKQTFDKMLSNMKEIEARNGPILAVGPQNGSALKSITSDIITIPDDLSDELACIPYSVAMQLFAYYIAKERGTEIDQPRNLAKSVTVE